jgi:hypothetical protein
MSTIGNKGLEKRYTLKVEIADSGDDRLLLLSLGELLRQHRIDGENLMNVPEDLGDKVIASRCWDDVFLCSKGLNPRL